MKNPVDIIFKTISCLCAAMVISSSVPSVSAEENETLKVGYVGFNNYMSPDKNGKMYGYGVEYLEMIGRVSGYDFEYVPCSWSAGLEMLLDKEIDLVCTANYTDERAEIYDYSTDFFAHMQGLLYTKADNDQIYYDDFEALEGKKIGFIRSALNIDMFAKFAENKGFSYYTYTYENEDELYNALKNDEIDAIATENSSVKDDLKIIGVYNTGEYYLMSYKDNDFMDNIDKAMAEIYSSDNNIKEKLYEKYLSGKSRNLSLTRKEAEYVENSGIIIVGMLYDRHPLSEYNEETGKTSGINQEIFNRISEISGLDFYYVPVPADASPVDELLNGKYTIAAGIGSTDTFLDDERIKLTDPYLISNAAAVGKIGVNSEAKESVTVACKRNAFEYQDIAREMFEDCNIVFYDTDIMCLDAVKDGKADYYVNNIYSVTYLLQSPVYSSLEMLPYNFIQDSFTAAVSADESPYLISIIEKSVKCISDDEMNEIILRRTVADPYKMTFTDVIHGYSHLLIAAALIVVALLGVITAMGAVNARKYIESNEENLRLKNEIDRLKQSDDEKKKLLFAISRDIRTPLNTISGIAAAAMRHKNDPELMDKYLDKIRISSGIIRETADAVTAACGRRDDDNNEKFLMFDILKEISEAYTFDLGRKDIDFTVNSQIICPRLSGNAELFRRFLGEIIDGLSGCIGRGGCISFSVSDAVEKDKWMFLKFIIECDRPQIAEPDFTKAGRMAEELSGALSYELTSTKVVVTCDVPFEKTDDPEDELSATGSTVNAYVYGADQNISAYIIMNLEKSGVSAFGVTDENELLSADTHDKLNVCFIGDNSGIDRISELALKIRSNAKHDVIIVAVADAASEIPDGCDYAVEKSRLQPQIFKIMLELTKIAESRKAPENAAAGFDFTGRRILIADDTEISAEITAEMLRLAGAECEVVTNGNSAVKMYEIFPAGTFDAIILALSMPGADGFEVCSEIRRSSHQDGKTVPIFALSASGLKSDVSAALAAGMNGHLTKPVENRALYKMLENSFKIREKA